MNMPDYVCGFDTETTGVDPFNDRIVTASFVILNVQTGKVETADQWLINPGMDIPDRATAVHGITSEKAAKEGLDVKQVLESITDLLRSSTKEGFPVVAFNAPFDLTLFSEESKRNGLDNQDVIDSLLVIDPMVLDKDIDKFRKGKRTLEVTCQHYGVEFEGSAHDATADSVAAARLAIKILQKKPSYLDGDLMSIQRVAAKQQNDSYRDFRLRKDPLFVSNTGWPVYEFDAFAQSRNNAQTQLIEIRNGIESRSMSPEEAVLRLDGIIGNF